MSFTYLNNTELYEALEIYIKHVRNTGFTIGVEEVPVQDSFGRITWEAVYARISSPHYNACAMDGIAVCAAKTFGATDTTPVVLKEGIDFARVDTGDPLPCDKYDAVIMIEDVIELEDGNVKIIAAAAPWQHIRQIGEDICANEMIIPSNTRIEPAAIGAMLAGGVLKVKVLKKPVVGIIPTGDEIVSPKDNPKEGEIIEFNSSIFSPMLSSWGAITKVYRIVPDKYELISDALVKACEECDLVLLNAGSSAGREDLSSKVIADAGRKVLHGIAIKPGKPTILGIVNDRPVIGVPGYPVSGIIVLESIVKSVLECIQGIDFPGRPKIKAVLSRKVMSTLKYREFVRVKLGDVGGKLVATPLNRGAGVVTSFVKADGIMEIPMNIEGFDAGREVEINLLKDEREIRNTLVVTGSHDPLLDIVSDIMKRRYPGEYVSSSHVGSMGGIMAIKRGEAHAAGIHLLDEDTGLYNKSYIKRYLPNEAVLTIKCVKRVQGLMVAKGNPYNLEDIGDIVKSGLRYVNRQKGSGTRILLDYLLSRNGIDSKGIYGYDREEFTHMAVAVLVASGSADAGLGIYSAARAYDLEFIPVCEEVYDFIVPQRFIELKALKNFIHILRSKEFKDMLTGLGGYIMDEAGRVFTDDGFEYDV
ncbi:MAG: molybdopterin biosynthesis protein [Bacillota bacterium]